jgi:hypothetical protein
MARVTFINALPRLVGNEAGPQAGIDFDDDVFATDTTGGDVTVGLKSGADLGTVVATSVDSASVTADKLLVPTAGELTIATGVVAATGSRHTVDTEADAAADDLVTISGGADGQVLILAPANAARVVTLKAGTGNIEIGTDFVMDDAASRIALISNGTDWFELSRANGS